MANLAERITVDSEQCGGRPCIRGMRIRVTDVLDLFASGLTAEQVMSELPDVFVSPADGLVTPWQPSEFPQSTGRRITKTFAFSHRILA